MKAKTTVVNMHYADYDVRIDRRSIFGNMFKIGPDGTRAEVIEKYRLWFYKQMAFDPEFRASVRLLKGLKLGCWCRPMGGFKGKLLCHGQIIVEYLEGAP